jgi:hypothetical protein
MSGGGVSLGWSFQLVNAQAKTTTTTCKRREEGTSMERNTHSHTHKKGSRPKSRETKINHYDKQRRKEKRDGVNAQYSR